MRSLEIDLSDKTNIATDKKDRFLCFLMAFICFVPNINYYICYMLEQSGLKGISIASYLLICIAALFCYIISVNRSQLPILIFAGIVFLYIITVVLWPENRSSIIGIKYDVVYNPVYRILWMLPLVFLPLVIRDKQVLLNYFVKFSYVNIAVALIAYIAFALLKGADYEYMTFAYNVTIPAYIIFIYNFNKKDKVRQVIYISLLVFVSILGSRGVLLSTIIFVFLYIRFIKSKSSNKEQFVTFVVVLLLAGMFIINYRYFAFKLNDILEGIGYSSRSLLRLVDGSVFKDKDRSNIAIHVWQSIKENPLFGNGIFGDRVYLKLHFSRETYAHNIILEFLCDFGVVFGGAVSLIYLYNSIKCLFNACKDEYYFIYLCVFSGTFFKMMVTSSYLIDTSFFMLVGFNIAVRKNQNAVKLASAQNARLN